MKESMIVNILMVINQVVIVMSYENIQMIGLNVKCNQIHVEKIYIHYSIKNTEHR